MGAGHDHGHSHGAGALRAGARHQKRLAISFVLIATFFVVEAVGGILTNSLGYGVDHATLQVEPDDHQGCDEVSW